MASWFLVRGKYMKVNLEPLDCNLGSKEKPFTNSRICSDGSNVTRSSVLIRGEALPRLVAHPWPDLTAMGPEAPWPTGRGARGSENEWLPCSEQPFISLAPPLLSGAALPKLLWPTNKNSSLTPRGSYPLNILPCLLLSDKAITKYLTNPIWPNLSCFHLHLFLKSPSYSDSHIPKAHVLRLRSANRPPSRILPLIGSWHHKSCFSFSSRSCKLFVSNVQPYYPLRPSQANLLNFADSCIALP